MKLNNIKITLFKELRGIFRDKKTIQKLILYPLIIPIFIIMFGFLFDIMSTNNYVIGTNYKLSNDEKMIIEDLDAFKTKSYKNKKELDKAYKEDKIDGYIIKEGNTYTIYSDRTVNSGEIIFSNISAYLETYNLAIGSNYLLNNNVDPNKVFNNLIIESKSLKEDNTDIMVSLLFNIVITYVIMIVVMVGVIIVPDATSGEKERGTLETILTFPIKCSELVVGKYLATAIMSFLVGVAAYLLSIPTFIIGNKVFESYGSVTFTTEFGFIILAILVIFLVSLLSAGACMALAGNAKTYKEAQSSLQMISLLPIIPYFLSMLEIDNIIFDFIPVANCSALLYDIVINNINIQSFLIIILTTIVYTVVILFYISKQYNSEETLFS